MATQQPLDPSIVNLAQAISKTETQGQKDPYTAKGGSGEYGAYQYTAPTWAEDSQKYLGQSIPLEQATPAQQDEVAYNKIKDLGSKGYNPSQIASIWNSGKPDPTGNIGTNSSGIKFDTPQYVKSVGQTYEQLRGGNTNPTTTPTSSTVGANQANQTPSDANQNTYGALNPASANDNLGTGLLKGLENIPSSAVNLGSNLWNALSHPIKTAENIVNVGAGGLETAENKLGLAGSGGNFNNQQTDDWTAFANNLKQRYGSLDALRRTAENDPVGLALDASTLATGVGAGVSAISDIGQAGDIADLTEGMSAADKASFIADTSREGALGQGAQIGQNLKDVGSAINPISLAAKGLGKVAGFAGNVGKYMLGQEGGVQSSTIGATLDNPGAFSSDAIAGANDSRTELGNQISQGLNDKLDALQETGSQYGDIRASNSPINVDSNFLAEQIQKNTGLDFNQDTGKFEFSTTGKVSSTADINKINDFFQKWQSTFDNGTMTPDEYLNMRQQLQKISFNDNGIGKSGELERAANGVRTSLNSNYRDQIPGLSELDAQNTAQSAEFQTLKDGLFDKNNELKSSAITKIANATGKGKTQLLAQLEEISPGITEKIGIQKALEDWQSAGEGIKVGTYGKAAGIIGGIATGAAGGGAVGAVIGGMAATLLTSPQVLVPMLRAVGASADLISSIMNKIASASPLNTNELTVFANAVSKANVQKKTPTSAFQLPQ